MHMEVLWMGGWFILWFIKRYFILHKIAFYNFILGEFALTLEVMTLFVADIYLYVELFKTAPANVFSFCLNV